MKDLVWVLLALAISLPAQAGREGNGGDPVAFEFVYAAREAIQDIQNSQGEYPSIKAAELTATLSITKIVIVNEILYASSGQTKQESAAVNYPDTNTIYLNRARWVAIKDGEIRKALALHELLGLSGKESTGKYPISQKYLKNRGLNCSDLCLSPPREPRFSFSEATGLYQSARMPTSEELDKTYTFVGVAFSTAFEKYQGVKSWYDASGKSGRLEFRAESNFSGTTTYIIANSYVEKSSDLNKIVALSREEQAACYSTPAGTLETQDGYGNVSSVSNYKSYFSYHCRILESDSQKLLCAQILSVHPSELGSEYPKSLDKKIVGYHAYVLKKK